jgi:hypothetical protein
MERFSRWDKWIKMAEDAARDSANGSAAPKEPGSDSATGAPIDRQGVRKPTPAASAPLALRRQEDRRPEWETRFPTAAALAEEKDAISRADYTVCGARLLRIEIFAEFIEVDREIDDCSNSVTRARMTRFGEMEEQELTDRYRRYLRRGSGIAEESLITRNTHQTRRY